MKQLKVINVFLVASVSAALHGIMAVIFVPAMSVMFLAHNTAQAQLSNPAITDNIMVWAVVAPILWAAVGFIGGALMAFIWNLFAGEPARESLAVTTSPIQVRPASQSSAA